MWPTSWLKQRWRQRQRQRLARQRQAADVEFVVDIAAPEVRQVSGYQKTLAESVVNARQYCRNLLKKVPGPAQLDRNAYFDDPTINALFASAEALEELTQLSPELRALRATGYHGEAIALLTATRDERTIFGRKREGELIIKDAAQQAVNFIEHRLVAPSKGLNQASEAISHYSLEVLATLAMEEITALRGKITSLREKRAYLQTAIKIFGGRTLARSRFTVPDLKMEIELKKAETALAQVEKQLAQAGQSLASPKDSLTMLQRIFANPAQVLAMRPYTMRLNWLNVRVEQNPEESGKEIALTEICLPDGFCRSALFVVIPPVHTE